MIGEGAFARVHKGVLRAHDVAVKILNLPEDEKRGPIVREFRFVFLKNKLFFFYKCWWIRREVRMMTRLAHSQIVQLLGFVLGDPMALVMEWCPLGNLYEFLHNGILYFHQFYFDVSSSWNIFFVFYIFLQLWIQSFLKKKKPKF